MNRNSGRFLSNFPALKQGLFTRRDPKATFDRILRLFERAGFYVAAADKGLMRFCGYRKGRQHNCTCMHVIWVRAEQESAYVSYGIEPRQGLIWSCSHRDHQQKLDQCGRAVRKAIDEVVTANKRALEVINGGRWRIHGAEKTSSRPMVADHIGSNQFCTDRTA